MMADNNDEAGSMNQGTVRYKCPCCGFRTFETPDKGDFEICPVCFWERDPAQFRDEDLSGGANSVSLRTARQNFLQYGACEEKFVNNVRPPRQDEMDTNEQ